MADATTFDVFETISLGTTYPSDTVAIYLDQESAYQIHHLEQEIADEKDGSRTDELETQRKELIEKVKNSALNIDMRGLPSKVRKAIREKIDAEFGTDTDSDEKSAAFTYALAAAHIIRVTRTDGAADNRAWTGDDVRRLLETVPDENAPRILDKISELTLKAAYFENVELSADFS